ncbi:type I restriction enzyme endonuclease domain-containing protein [Micromonospora luteifusca]|uniref:type I restriction enzyme endonuclease domain-containing protein n=1 Tax=Micromonospora luteifusca TaxID=709860 RepID=UPI0033BD5367
MRRYTNENLTSAEIIDELVAMAKEVSAEANRGQQFSPALTSDELAFYDAVADNESAVAVMTEGQLEDIARDLVTSVCGPSPSTGPPATTYAPSSARPSSVCWPCMAIHRTQPLRRSSAF